MTLYAYRKPVKIGLVGGGNIGGTLAHLCLQRRLGDVVIIDVAEGVPQGKSLDLGQSAVIEGLGGAVYPDNSFEELKGCDVVIVTAGLARKPGMSREDLLAKNAEIIKGIGEKIRDLCPDAFVIVVTNPLDAMVWVMQKTSQLPTHRVVGMAGILDSGRFAYFLSEALQVSPRDIQTLVLGGHGDTMVPLPRYTSVAGTPLLEWVEKGRLHQKDLEAIIERTRNGGAEIVGLLKTGSAYYAPASAALTMAESYLLNQRRLLPCAAWVNGEYGVRNIYVGVPIIIGSSGVEEVIEISLREDEKYSFDQSIIKVQNLIEEVSRLI